MKMKAYLDTNIVSAIAKDDTPTESEALNRILMLYKEDQLELTTSKLTFQEIERVRGKNKKILERVYLLLQNVPFAEDQELVGMHVYGDRFTWINSPIIEEDPIASTLWKIGLDRMDAHHLMLAILAECDVFITCDNGILSQCTEIEDQFSIRLMTPSAFLNDLT